MVFSRTCLNQNNGLAAIISFNEDLDFQQDGIFNKMALELASVEGINASNSKLRKSWGCIALYINPKGSNIEKIKILWESLKGTDQDYSAKRNRNFRINDSLENSTLLNDDYTLSSDVKIETDLDFLFLTYIKPAHRDSSINEYPSIADIAIEINRSGYDNYLKNNIANGIATFQDKEIIRLLDS